MRHVIAMLLAIGLAAGEARACTCGYLSPARAVHQADVVFAGVVESVTVVDGEDTYEPRVVVRFNVGRVWKGPVGQAFTMHTYLEFSSCSGFYRELAQPGRVLLVFGRAQKGAEWKHDVRLPFGGSPDARSATVMPKGADPAVREDLVAAVAEDATIYGTDICAGSVPWEDAGFHVRELGKFSIPDRGYRMNDAPAFSEFMLPAELRGVPPVCWQLRMARDWKSLAMAPPEWRDLEAILTRHSKDQGALPPGVAEGQIDHWMREGEDTIALCRAPRDPLKKCGALVAMFSRQAGGKDRTRSWQLGAYDDDPCLPRQ